MQGLASDYLLLLAALLSTLAPGVAVLRARTQLRGIDLIGYGFAAGVVLQALFGLGIACAPRARSVIVAADVLGVLASVIYVWRARVLQELRAATSRPMLIALALWFSFVAGCIALTHVEVAHREPLPDGRYIFKGPTVNVKLQHLTILPTDNVVPFLVSEYLLRRISFRKEAPILPGQEISNRTILLSLVAMPYRAAISPPPRWKGSLGKFEYVGKRWPAVQKLYSDAAYRQVLVIGIFLNALLFVGLLVLFQHHARDSVVLPCAMLLAGTSVYFITQTVFIWPKALAAFFILLALHSLRARHHPAVVGTCAALAYHSHPYAAMFAVGIGCLYLARSLRERALLRSVAVFAGTFALLIAPWFVWTRLILGLREDLLWQNLAGPGTETGMSSALNFVWERVINVFELFVPTLFGVYPYDPLRVSELAQQSLPAAVGIFVIVPALIGAYRAARRHPGVWWTVGLPAAVIVLLFSYRAMPIMHGLQVVVGLLLVCGIVQLRSRLTSGWFWSVITLQLAANLVVLWLRATVTGVHLP